ncbi:hypothetical protein LU293_04315 [Moraxella nasovis]|uniref:hypothetical protein n=1 Tax=Moraxella nasovis TaxID=2904121 RepID=UPI001F60FA4B|nr:hypothetical protein [Moraxella nasovis]UNU74127.1 hypothetical protein LU293_04315 [Moraxella nasovis]
MNNNFKNGYGVTDKGFFIIYEDLDVECGFPSHILNLNQVTTLRRKYVKSNPSLSILYVNGKKWYKGKSIDVDDMLSWIEWHMGAQS